MTVKSFEIQFLQCDGCGEHAPAVFDSDRGTHTDGDLAQDAAREQEWNVNGDGLDWCPSCVTKYRAAGARPIPDEDPLLAAFRRMTPEQRARFVSCAGSIGVELNITVPPNRPDR